MYRFGITNGKALIADIIADNVNKALANETFLAGPTINIWGLTCFKVGLKKKLVTILWYFLTTLNISGFLLALKKPFLPFGFKYFYELVNFRRQDARTLVRTEKQ
uniref:Uncharacterized protein n=1 Tax=Glossina austeni TaxID=7395 RepID=A0A1A9V4F7_GLOAU